MKKLRGYAYQSSGHILDGHDQSGVVNIANLLTGTHSEFWCPTGADGVLFQNSGGTGAVANGDPVGYVGAVGGDTNLLQSSATLRPLYNATGGNLLFDDSNDALRASLTTRSASTYFCCVVRGSGSTDSSRFALASYPDGSGSNYLLAAQSGSTATPVATTGTPYIDGVLFSGNRGDAWTALMDDSPHIFESVGANITAAGWANFDIGQLGAPGWGFGGYLADFVLTASPSAAVRAKIRGVLAARHGITL